MKINNLSHFKFFSKECDILLQSLSVFAAFAYFFLCLPVQESYFRAGVLCVKYFNGITFTSPGIGIWNFFLGFLTLLFRNVIYIT